MLKSATALYLQLVPLGLNQACVFAMCAPGLIESADAASRQNQLVGTPAVLGRLTVRGTRYASTVKLQLQLFQTVYYSSQPCVRE